MTANLNGIRFDQVYGDNSGGPEFDTDRDGTATQEDEFVSFTNSTDSAIDVSGWQIWSDATGSGAPDSVQDGLFHTFPAGTFIAPGDTLYIINEITGTPPSWAQEASEGGVESGAGGTSTNFLSEGSGASGDPESIALVDPVSGDFIVFNMDSQPSQVENISGFPGTTKIGEVDGSSVQADQAAGSSYQYNSTTDQYEYNATFTPCFVTGTMIETNTGLRRIERLKTGDYVRTMDHGFQPVKWIGKRVIDLTNSANSHLRPIYLGKLGLSPQHRVLLDNDTLAPAKGMCDLGEYTLDTKSLHVTYFHLLLPAHEIIFAQGRAVESLLPGPTFLATCHMSDRLEINRMGLANLTPARRCLTVAQTRRYISKFGQAA